MEKREMRNIELRSSLKQYVYYISESSRLSQKFLNNFILTQTFCLYQHSSSSLYKSKSWILDIALKRSLLYSYIKHKPTKYCPKCMYLRSTYLQSNRCRYCRLNLKTPRPFIIVRDMNDHNKYSKETCCIEKKLKMQLI